jgi:hypothetical protein
MKAYDGEANAPDCWSQDGKKPSPDASNPQHSKCDGCQQNMSLVLVRTAALAASNNTLL